VKERLSASESAAGTIHVVGVISDTHNFLRAEALSALRGCDMILHGGDVCSQGVLDELRKIAPVSAVRGNNDKGDWADRLPVDILINIGDLSVYMIHNLKEMKAVTKDKRISVVISGHSHKPYVEERNGVLYLNPGSAGRQRFKLPVSLARLTINGTRAEAEIIDLVSA
jgi:uncharacterized protein